MFLSESICLQFTSSGYNRAKSMLDAKFGGSTKVDKVHIMAIRIYGVNLQNVHEFYEKLITRINIINTIGKLKD